MFKKIWNKFLQFNLWIWKQVKDVRTLIILIIVAVVLSCEVWGSYLIGFITGNEWFFAIGSACWVFWLGPFTPFWTLCIGITLGIKKLLERRKKHEKRR